MAYEFEKGRVMIRNIIGAKKRILQDETEGSKKTVRK